MPKLPIVIAPDERLVTQSSKVIEIDEKIKKLVDSMFETVEEAKGFGLAAVQVGVLKRIFVTSIPIEYQDEEESGYQSTGFLCMINPEITELSDEHVTLTEGCLSIPEQTDNIKRPKYLTARYTDLDDKEQIIKASGWLARCIQHELDHLNGILYIKHLSKLKYNMAMRKAQKVKKLYE